LIVVRGFSAADNGFEVAGAQGFGLYVSRADDDGGVSDPPQAMDGTGSPSASTR
jgi:hypothetical protein